MSLTDTSRYMSLILRHKPETIGISLDEHGWANVDELIAKASSDSVIVLDSEVYDFYSSSNLKNYKYDWVWDKVIGTGFLNSKKQYLDNYSLSNNPLSLRRFHPVINESIEFLLF